jgi:hypothetical protein
MTSWIGRRVQIVGSMVPSASGTAASGAAASSGAAGPTGTFPEFRVVSVQPMTGDCPPR